MGPHERGSHGCNAWVTLVGADKELSCLTADGSTTVICVTGLVVVVVAAWWCFFFNVVVVAGTFRAGAMTLTSEPVRTVTVAPAVV